MHWRVIALNSFSAMFSQLPCLGVWQKSMRRTSRRFPTAGLLREETTAWHQHTNDQQRGVDWQFKVDDARVKLKSVYPKLQV